MRELGKNELKQWALENYRAIQKWLKVNFRALSQPGEVDSMEGNMNAYRETLQRMGYTWKELKNQEFVNKEIKRLREETTLSKKQEILNKFWHDFSDDLYRYDTEEYEGMIRYFKGYSNGLLQAGIIEVKEHIDITNEIDSKINTAITMKEKRFI